MATAEFSKLAGILSAALSQHHLSGFENSSTGTPSPPLALFIVMLSKAHLTSQIVMPVFKQFFPIQLLLQKQFFKSKFKQNKK